MGKSWASQWASGWDSTRFNQNHAKAGSPTGGQFTSSGGGGSGGSKGSEKTKSTHAAPSATSGHGTAARKAALHAKADADRAEARKLEAELRVLERKHANAAADNKKAAQQASTAKAAAGKHHATATQKAHAKVSHHKAQAASTHHATLKQRIREVKERIADLRAQARALDVQAAKL